MGKRLVVCNEESFEFFLQLNEAFDVKSVKNASTDFIVVREQMLQYTLNSSEYEVWILVELSWNSDRNFEGYDIALEILRNRDPRDRVLNITFFTLATRGLLYREFQNEKAIFPRAFRHVQLPVLNVNDIDLKPVHESTYRYVRNYALSRSNIIAEIIHAIANYDEKRDHPPLHSILDRVDAIADLLSPAILEQVKVIRKTRLGLIELDGLLRELYRSYADNRVLSGDNRLPKLRTVVIVEDNPSDASELEKLFSNHCEKLKNFSDGAKAQEYIRQNIKEIDLLLCDLELLESDGMFWQEIQGVEILESVMNDLDGQKCYRVALSGLPVTAVEVLTSGKKYYQEHIRKRAVLDSNLDQNTFARKVLKAARKYNGIQAKGKFPTTGKLKLVREHYLSLLVNQDPEIERLEQEVRVMHHKYQNGTLNVPEKFNTRLPTTSSQDFFQIWERLNLILGLRRMVISFAVNGGKCRGKEYFFDYNSFREPEALSSLKDSFKTFICTDLSLNVTDLNEFEKTCYIRLENLTSYESKFVDDWLKRGLLGKVVELESLKGFERFMDEVNDHLNIDIFDKDDNYPTFVKKLSEVIHDMIKERYSVAVIREFDGYIPYSASELRVYKEYDELASLLESLEKLIDSLEDA